MILITHRRNDCIGCNSCVEHAPLRWRMDELDGKSQLIGSTKKGEHFVLKVSDDELEANKLAEQDCPVNIIHVEKKDFLKQERERIDCINKEILLLLKKRMLVVEKIFEYKEKEYLTIEDLEREKEIIDLVKKESQKESIDTQFAQEIFKTIINSSKSWQKRVIVNKK
ncbi:MAG: chorismate mutase [bacterium]|nr:chorismate mutase [bacterium]